MNFVCSTCGKSFDIGAPAGVTIPCPACGGMLSAQEEETPAPAEEAAPEQEFDSPLAAAEAYAAQDDTERPPTYEVAGADGEYAPVEQEGAYAPPAALPEGAAAPAEGTEVPAYPDQVGVTGTETPGWQEGYPAEGGEQAYEAGAYAQAPDAAYPMPEAGELPPLPAAEGEYFEEAPRAGGGALAWSLFLLALIGCGGLGFLFFKKQQDVETARKEVASLQTKVQTQTADITKLTADVQQTGTLAEQLGTSEKLVKDLEARLAEADKSTRTLTERLTSAQTARDALQKRMGAMKDEIANVQQLKADLQKVRAMASQTEAVVQIAEASRALAQGVVLAREIGRREEAEARLRDAIKKAPSMSFAYLQLGKLLAELRGPSQAVAVLAKADAVAGDNGSPEALYYAGRIAYDRLAPAVGRAKAESYFGRAAGQEGTYAGLAAARLLLLNEQVDEAVKKADGVLRDDPSSADAAYEVGLALSSRILANDDVDRAISVRNSALEYLGKACKLNPMASDSFSLRSDLLLDAYEMARHPESFEEGFRIARRSVELCPESGLAQFVLGRAYRIRKEYDKAESHLTAALDADSWRIRALQIRGEVLLQVGKAREAIEDFQKVLESDASDQQALCGRGRAYLAAGRNSAAQQDLAKAVELAPDWPEVHAYLAEAYLSPGTPALKKLEAAGIRARKAAELSKRSNPMILGILARVLAEEGDKKKALQTVREALRLAPGDEGLKKLENKLARKR